MADNDGDYNLQEHIRGINFSDETVMAEAQKKDFFLYCL
jgi:hypothetical protein